MFLYFLLYVRVGSVTSFVFLPLGPLFILHLDLDFLFNVIFVSVSNELLGYLLSDCVLL